MSKTAKLLQHYFQGIVDATAGPLGIRMQVKVDANSEDTVYLSEEKVARLLSGPRYHVTVIGLINNEGSTLAWQVQEAVMKLAADFYLHRHMIVTVSFEHQKFVYE